MTDRLDEAMLLLAVGDLTRRDERLAEVVRAYGPPPLWARRPGFPTLLHIILEQQVSLASAGAAFGRLSEEASPLTPERFLQFDDTQLKTIGFSRQKTRYGRALAEALLSGRLDLESLDSAPEDVVRERLTSLPGIGSWTADIYILMALGRPDVWPSGDLALATALRGVLALTDRPGPDAMRELAEGWRPWRAVAARILWHWYLSSRARAK